MALNALDSIPDPLLTPLLALLKDAVNADLALDMAAAGAPVEAAIATVSKVPFTLSLEGEGTLPALHAYRIRSSTSRATFVHLNHVSRLQFAYATPATGRDLLDARWPLLDRVWHAMLRALRRGGHANHAAGADVLLDAGVVSVALTGAFKREAFIEGAHEVFPGFVAEVDVTWRNALDVDQGPFFPVLSLDAQLYVDRDVDLDSAPDVHARAVTPAGTPPGNNFPEPDDWSL